MSAENVRPKSIARAMVERLATFNEYVREYDLARSEGLLLRYLSDAVKTADQSVPDALKNDAFDDALHFLRTELRTIDASLLDEWDLRQREEGVEKRPRVTETPLVHDAKRLLVTVRGEVHRLLKLLAERNFEAASGMLVNQEEWPTAKLAAALDAYLGERRALLVHHDARKAEFTTLRAVAAGRFDVWQTLVDPERENDWRIEASVELASDVLTPPERLLSLVAITS